MRDFLKFVWLRHKVLGLVTAGALIAAAVFAADFIGEARYFHDPAHRNRTIEPWMSIRYVEKSWGLTKPIMFDLIGADLGADRKDLPRSVGAYLATSGTTLAEFQARVAEAQAKRHPEHRKQEHGK